jgi:hypothetical protein
MIWFNRKPRNRRLGRGHVLDVKLRSEQVRASRLRIFALALGLLFATILGFYLIWCAGAWGLNRLIYQNKSFAIQEIDVQTDGVIAVDQLRRWAGVKPGENLLALDMARVKRDLEMVSAIRSVAVERLMPHTLRLRITERDPLAQIYVPQMKANGGFDMTILQLDDEGYVMSILDPRQRAIPAAEAEGSLQVIVGNILDQPVPGRRIDSPQIRSALQLISAFEHSPMSGLVDMVHVDVSSPEVLEVTTSQQSKIIFSVQNLDQQLRRWHDIYIRGQGLGKAIATLDLSVSNNIPARWIEASAVPSMTPKNKTLQRLHKRNV